MSVEFWKFNGVFIKKINMRVVKILLTKEQQKIAAENHNLIYGFLNSNKLDVDEWYGDAAIGFCKSIATYNPDSNFKISTYAYVCMRNQVQRQKKKQNINILSLDAESVDGMSILSSVDDKSNMEEDITTYISFLQKFSTLNPRQKRILQLRQEKYTQGAISKIMNTSDSTISRELSKMKEQLFA